MSDQEKPPAPLTAGTLRLLRKHADLKAEEYRKMAHGFGVSAVQYDRQLAELPCEIERDHHEMVIHLGWKHRHSPAWRHDEDYLKTLHRNLMNAERAGVQNGVSTGTDVPVSSQVTPDTE